MAGRTARTDIRTSAPKAAEPRHCEWPDCDGLGEYRAPRSRDDLNSYRWFCLDHIREYNRSWNYYAGMTDDEVEADVRRDTVWHRPTWQLGTNPRAYRLNDLNDPFGLFADAEEPAPEGVRPRPPLGTEEEKAYKTLGLEYPVTEADVKARYKELVKRYHPDAAGNGGRSDDRIKEINGAYRVLRKTFTR